MPALRIDIIPNLLEARQKLPQEKEGLLNLVREDVAAQHIAGLVFGFACTLQQCLLWVKVPSESLTTLQTFLDGKNIQYDVYDETMDDPNKQRAEDKGDRDSSTAGR